MPKIKLTMEITDDNGVGDESVSKTNIDEETYKELKKAFEGYSDEQKSLILQDAEQVFPQKGKYLETLKKTVEEYPASFILYLTKIYLTTFLRSKKLDSDLSIGANMPGNILDSRHVDVNAANISDQCDSIDDALEVNKPIMFSNNPIDEEV